MKRIIVLIAALSVSLAAVATAAGAAPWSLFGGATAVNVGAPPNPWAVKLSSTCPSFPSLTCLGDGSFTFSGVDFTQPNGKLTFAGLWWLATDYNVTVDDCGAGSPRFQLNMDTDNDGTVDGNIFVYIGPYPSFAGCAAGWQSTGNMIGSTTLRFDQTQLGGAFYGSYADALTNFGSADVLGIQLVVDSGWNGPATTGDGVQTVLVDNVTINDHKLTARSAR